MASKPLGTIRHSQIVRGKPERHLFRKLQAAGVELREDFKRFLTRSDVLEDMAREARRVLPESAFEKRFEIGKVGTLRKATKPIPPELQAIVTRALNRARPLWEDFEANIRADILSEEIQAFERGAQGAMRQVGFEGVFDLTNPRILDYLATRANMLAGDVSDSNFEAIMDTITSGFFDRGLGPLDVAKELKNEFDFLTSARSRTIARTETLIASEQGQFEQWYVVGVEEKRWMSVRDERVREAHVEAEGQTVALVEPFIVGGEELMHPGDPTGSPENIINCRCGSGPIVEARTLDEPWLGD